VRTVRRDLKAFGMFEKKLAGTASAKQVQRPPENHNWPDSVIFRNLWCEFDLAREMYEVVLLRRQEDIV